MKAKISTLLLGSVLTLSAQADEGQWQPHQLKQLQSEFDRVGIQLPASQVADLDAYPLNAVIGLGYCSASFVSPQGLVITNHHCAYGAIQNNSSAERNLIEAGFLAKSLAEELPAGPQERLYITEQVTDVTEQVLGELDDELHGLARYEAIQAQKKALIAGCETSDNYRCSVRAFHHGMQYFLIKQLMLKDVRLVYAPPGALGNFGGDIDNFEYPRHTADFAFVRGYVSPTGEPTEYAEQNVPYQPASYLKVNAQGINPGDGILVAGYPGRTSRYKLVDEIRFAAEWDYPHQLRQYNRYLEVVAQHSAKNPQAAVKYASRVKSINNRLKKRQGLLDGFKATDIIGIKAEQEDAFMQWLAADSERNAYKANVEQLKTLVAEQQQLLQRQSVYQDATQSDLLGAAVRLYRLAKESEKPDAERELGYQTRNLPMIKARIKRLQSRYLPSVDQAIWSDALQHYLMLGSDKRVPALDTALAITASTQPQQMAEKVKALYAASSLQAVEGRLAWIGQPVSAFTTSADPLIQLAVALYDTNIAMERERKALAGKLAESRPQYMQALIEYNREQGKPVYPDANSTLRVSYGQVDGYPAADGVYKTPFTSLRGLVQKHQGKKPFIVPEATLQAYKEQRFGPYYRGTLVQQQADQKSCWLFGNWLCSVGQQPGKQFKLNSVPVNFLSSADTTGGNSGSPVLNGKGELVGLNFDSTYESITKDWYFNAEITRAIHVDIRYILWLMDEVDHADNLLQEMGINQ